jgi:hypothetical protein
VNSLSLLFDSAANMNRRFPISQSSALHVSAQVVEQVFHSLIATSASFISGSAGDLQAVLPMPSSCLGVDMESDREVWTEHGAI